MTPTRVFGIVLAGGEGKRLKVTQGNHDGQDRVRLGTIEIK